LYYTVQLAVTSLLLLLNFPNPYNTKILRKEAEIYAMILQSFYYFGHFFTD